jgi:GTPase
MTLTVAIVGRPNVGKSTLFNRLVGKRLALVDDMPGVTRDRREGDGRIGALKFRVIDTAGLEDASGETLGARMRKQTEAALKSANVALFLIDARAGITPMDRHFADWLRTGATPVRLLANKCEGKAGESGFYEAFELGLGEPIAISAEHGDGMTELHDAIADIADGREAERGPEAEETSERPLQIAIVGRPNSGKSTLINRILGEDRLVTGPEAGLTRDSIGLPWTYKGQPVKLFDTAGLRKKSKVFGKLERLSVADAMRAIQFADVVTLLIDGELGLEKQDAQIASLVHQEGRALVIAINKWDLVKDRKTGLKSVRERVETVLPQVRGVPVITLSAATGEGVNKLMPEIRKINEQWCRRIGTPALNRWLEGVVTRNPPPAVRGRRLRLRYITQIKTRPPTLVLFVSKPADLPEAYERYLVNALREDFEMPGVPIRLLKRRGENPFAPKKG